MSMLGFLHNFIFFFCLVFSAKSSIISITQHTQQCAGWRWLAEGRQKRTIAMLRERVEAQHEELERGKGEKLSFFRADLLNLPKYFFSLPYPVMLQRALPSPPHTRTHSSQNIIHLVALSLLTQNFAFSCSLCVFLPPAAQPKTTPKSFAIVTTEKL